MKDVDVQVEHLKMPVSSLNQLRRDAIEKFENALEESIIRKNKKEIILDIPKNQQAQEKRPKVC